MKSGASHITQPHASGLGRTRMQLAFVLAYGAALLVSMLDLLVFRPF